MRFAQLESRWEFPAYMKFNLISTLIKKSFNKWGAASRPAVPARAPAIYTDFLLFLFLLYRQRTRRSFY